MQMLHARKRFLAIVSAVCGVVVALCVAVPAAHATVGGKCKLDTPTTPVASRDGNGNFVIKSSAVMWCEEDAEVSTAYNRLFWSTGYKEGQIYNFTAKKEWRYVLEVQQPCNYNQVYYNVHAKASFYGPEGFVYNTSGLATKVVCR